MTRLFSSAVSIAAFTAAAHAQSSTTRSPIPGAPAGVTAVVDVNVVPMDTDRVLPNHTVLVQHGRITALGPSSQVNVPVGAVQIDGRGKYLSPGLADMHTHMRRTLLGAAADAALDRQMLVYVSNGITTIRNMDHITTPDAGVRTLRLRARAAAGEIFSPRIYTSGRWRTYTTGVIEAGTYTPADNVADVAPQIVAYKAAGYDFIKVYSWDRGAVFDSLMAVARREGLPVVGHVPVGVTGEQAIAAGMKSIEHQMGYYSRAPAAASPPVSAPEQADEARVAALVAATKHAGVWNCPTFSLSNPRYSLVRGRIVKMLQDAGAGLLVGTDKETVDAHYALVLHQELAKMVQVGLTPYQALAAGTRNAAQYFGTLDETGTIAVGKRADLVLLNDNPLADVRNVAAPAGVMLGGRWLAREEIDRRLAETP